MAKNGDNMDYTLKIKRCQEYIESLEEEQKKIQVFKRELPMCLLLVTQAIESYRKELSEFSRSEHIQSEGSERTTSECEGRDGSSTALFEEFIPIKYDEHESCERIKDDEAEKKKSEWLQLWNQSPDDDPLPKEDQKTTVVVEVKGDGGAFQPFQKEMPADSQPLKAITPTPTASSSTVETGGNKKEMEQQKKLQMHRKQRRCWSQELHRRFLHALQQLGGSQVATPKQIRDLMQVDGLTNDEVKSHLQKYRLHTRRPATPTTVTNGGENPQQPQLIVVEGIWVPSRDAVNNRVYAPVAVQPPPRSSPSEARSIQRCNPPTASSSTHPAHLLPLS